MADEWGSARSSDESELVAGADEDGLVTVTVTADRAHVVDVALDPEWRRAIMPAELAATVLRAFHSAQAAVVATQVAAVEAAPAMPETADSGPAPGYVQDLISTVLRQLDGYVARADQVRASRFDVASPKRAVTVLTSGGQIAAVTIDPEWARRAPTADLAREVRAAFAAAQAGIEELAAEVGGPTREMAELNELIMDPTRFVGLLGMRGGRADNP